MKEEWSFFAVMGGNIDGQVSVYEIEMSNSKNFPTMTILFIFFFWLIIIHVSDLYPFPFILVMLVTAKRRCRAAIPGQIGAQIKFASLRLLFRRPTESLEGSNYKSPLKRGCHGSSWADIIWPRTAQCPTVVKRKWLGGQGQIRMSSICRNRSGTTTTIWWMDGCLCYWKC